MNLQRIKIILRNEWNFHRKHPEIPLIGLLAVLYFWVLALLERL